MNELISKKRAEFIDKSIALQDPESREFKEIAYWARVWVQAAFPHSDPGPVNVWGRQNGKFTLTIQPGADYRNGREINYGLPYGSIPRLLMSWMCTEAVQTKNRKLFLGDTLSEFMKEIGIGEATGGRWGSIPRLKKQMPRLFESRITYRWKSSQGDVRKTIPISNEGVTWWSEASPKQSSLFPSYVVLSHDFFEEITNRPVPIKLQALRLLKQSPLALDLYTWLTYRVFNLEQPLFVSWTELKKQFGSDYKSQKEFARACRQHIKSIKLVYPELNIDETHRGRLELKPSQTHVVAVPGKRKIRSVDKSGN